MAQVSRSQTAVFETARDSIASDLDDQLKKESFEGMLERLTTAARAYSAIGGVRNANPIRYFTTHHLKMPGDRGLEKVRAWIRLEEPMTYDNVILVLRTLQKLLSVPPLGDGKRGNRGRKPGVLVGPRLKTVLSRAKVEEASTIDEVPEETPAVTRGVIDLAISFAHSVSGLMADARVTPADVHDGDRMHLASAIEHICKMTGIKATITGVDLSKLRPVSKKEFSNFVKGGENET